MPSIKDVATAAGVSYTTVSHVLNDTRPVSESTKAKVNEAISKLGYVPNRNARCLRRGESRTIGVIGTDPSDHFFHEVMSYTASHLAGQGYRMEFAYAGYAEGKSCREINQREIDALEEFLRHGTDAVILNTGRTDADLKSALADLDKPSILFQRDIPGSGSCGIESDDYAGGFAAAEHLIETGCRRIAVLKGFAYRSHSVNSRIRGIETALEEAEISFPKAYCKNTLYSEAEAYNGTINFMNLDAPPDGIICYSDLMAMAAVRALSDRGLRVPNDVSVIGYDDIPLARLTVPRLTTIRQNPAELGRTIAEKTLESIELGQSAESPPPLPVELIVRESTRMQKKAPEDTQRVSPGEEER